MNKVAYNAKILTSFDAISFAQNKFEIEPTISPSSEKWIYLKSIVIC